MVVCYGDRGFWGDCYFSWEGYQGIQGDSGNEVWLFLEFYVILRVLFFRVQED